MPIVVYLNHSTQEIPMNTQANDRCTCTYCPQAGCQCGCQATASAAPISYAAASCSCGAACRCEGGEQGCLCG
jgi:hypothetical protein